MLTERSPEMLPVHASTTGFLARIGMCRMTRASETLRRSALHALTVSCARVRVVAVKVHADFFVAALSKRAIMEAWEWAPLHALLSRSACQATTSRTPPLGMPLPSARSNACMGTSCSSTTTPSKPHPNPRRRPLAATQPPMRVHTRSLPQAPRTTAMATSYYRNSTAFIWHSRGGRCPPQRPPCDVTRP